MALCLSQFSFITPFGRNSLFRLRCWFDFVVSSYDLFGVIYLFIYKIVRKMPCSVISLINKKSFRYISNIELHLYVAFITRFSLSFCAPLMSFLFASFLLHAIQSVTYILTIYQIVKYTKTWHLFECEYRFSVEKLLQIKSIRRNSDFVA